MEDPLGKDKKFCACGCGREVVSRNKEAWARKRVRFCFSHRMSKRPIGIRLCACGCGTNIPLTDNIGRIHIFKNGHNSCGSNNPSWKGGTINTNGYRFKWIGVNRRKLEHRLIYEEYYKCCLLPWSIVHHINEDKLDNRIENLEGMMRRQHPPLHNKRDPKTGSFIKSVQ